MPNPRPPCKICVKLGIDPPNPRRNEGKCFIHGPKKECKKCLQLGLENVKLARNKSEYCLEHGAMLKCKENGCDYSPQKSGYCDSHYLKRFGVPARKKCVKCNDSFVHISGMCHHCYNKSLKEKSEEEQPKIEPKKQIINPVNQQTIAKLRKRLGDIINGVLKDQSCTNLTGVNVEKLKKHLELQFEENMNWDNINKTWHIDFIKAPSTFVANPEKAFYYKNLIPVSGGKYKYR